MQGSFGVVFQARSKNGVVLAKGKETIHYHLEDEGLFEREVNHSIDRLSPQELSKLAELIIFLEP